jgi:iron complex outermembrane receptor protein
MVNRSRNVFFVCGVLLLSRALAQQTPASAQSDTVTNSTTSIEEIIVTAQRRKENLQDVPISINVVTSSALESTAVTSTQTLPALVPGLMLADNGDTIEPFIRGVGSNNNAPGNELPVAFYVDNVYVASADSNLLDLADVDSISVLKGPQGTLFGRNAVGGVVQITTKTPSPGQTPEGSIAYSYDNFRTSRYDFFGATGLTPTMAASLSGVYSSQGDGYGRDDYTGEDERKIYSNVTLRGKFVYTPTDTTEITLSADWTHRRDSLSTQFTAYPGTSFVLPGYVQPANPWSSDGNFPAKFQFLNDGTSLTIDQDLGFAHFVSISAYRHDRLDFFFDLDGTPTQGAQIGLIEPSRELTQEFQLNSSNAGPVKWTAGLFYINYTGQVKDADIDILPATPAYFGAPPINTQVEFNDRQPAVSVAGYGQATAQIVKDTNLTVGVRYTTETRKFTGQQDVLIDGTDVAPSPLDEKLVFQKTTYRASLDHKFTDDVLTYVSYNTGFKSGGFNAVAPTNPAYLPETLTAYELGAKTEFADHRIRLNAALFDYERTNVQVDGYVGASQLIYNGASARHRGLDVDFIVRATEGLSFKGGFVALDARFKNFPGAIYYTTDPVANSPVAYSGSAAGKQVPFASKWSGNASVDYGLQIPNGRLDFDITDSPNSGFYSEPDNHLHQASYNLLSSSIKWTLPNSRYSVLLWGRNLLNEVIFGQGNSLASFGYEVDNSNPPRTYGITLKASF